MSSVGHIRKKKAEILEAAVEDAKVDSEAPPDSPTALAEGPVVETPKAPAEE